MVIPSQGSVPLPSHHRLQMQRTDWMRRRSAAWNGYNTRKSIHPGVQARHLLTLMSDEISPSVCLVCLSSCSSFLLFSTRDAKVHDVYVLQ
ncbi:hypothetical protein LZ31DRAFT_96569 [Colletotrichum somersetense]|nr:hypothetical protein LZ31DRAFT_96569 [Colletotrichum somersetense]